MSALYRLNEGTPDEDHLTAAEFFDANEDMAGTEVETAVRSLLVGETYQDGGGAQPVWTIRRVS